MPHQVTVVRPNTTLPNGFTYPTGSVVILSNEQFAKLQAGIFTRGNLTDGGNIP
jgi:hypothetical protein